MATTTEIPEKWVLKTSEKKLPAAIGITEERWDQLQETAKTVALRAVVTDVKIEKPAQAYEILLNEAAPQSVIEAFILGVLYENAEGQFRKIAESLKESLHI